MRVMTCSNRRKKGAGMRMRCGRSEPHIPRLSRLIVLLLGPASVIVLLSCAIVMRLCEVL